MRILVVASLLAAACMPAWGSRLQATGGSVPFTMYECVEPFCTEIPPNVVAAIGKEASPGMVLGAINAKGEKLFVGGFGRFTYDETSALATNETRYDMASLSKIIGATTATAVLYQKGYLGIDEKVSSARLLGPDFSNQGKGDITIKNLLLHNAGYPPDPVPGYGEPAFGCPETSNYFPGQNFGCVSKIYNDLLFNQKLANPVGKEFVYSDLSMITLMFVVGKLVKDEGLVKPSDFEPFCNDANNLECYYNAFLTKKIWPEFGFGATGFCPTNAELTPPEWEEYNGYRHSLVKGYVSDGNAYAMGGISGHAGIFSDAADAMSFMQVWLNEAVPSLVNKTTIDLFTTVGNITQSSRALGWDTNDQSYKFCGTMSPKTFTHTGYTGTELCGDPVTGLATVMLTNGRYPNRNTGMSWYRPEFNTLVHDLFVKMNARQ